MTIQEHASEAKRLIWKTLVMSLVVAACGTAGVEGPEIPLQDPALVSQGEPLYLANCAACHGEDLRGTDRGPSHLSIVYEPNHHGDFAFQQAVAFGSPQHHWRFGPMAPVPGLTEDQVKSIIAFVRETQRTDGFEPYPP